MSCHKSTDELIKRLARGRPAQSLWPSFPVVPFIVCLTFGLLIEFAAGVHQREWSALSNANLTMALLALVTALFGLMLCLEFASPTGHLDLLVGTVAVFFAAVAISALARAPALAMDQVMRSYWLIVLMASPGLLTGIWLLRRGASLHPSFVGAGAGMFSGGIASLLFLLHCLFMPNGSGIHAEIAAISTLSLIGAFLGRVMLKW